MPDDQRQLRQAVEDFEAGCVDPAAFDQAAHVRIAWCYLRLHPPFEAIRRFSAALEALTRRLGVADKYHATITGFFLLLIAERMALEPAADWEAFRDGNGDLFHGSGALLRSHYSRDRLDSATARRQFLLPDLARAPASGRSTAAG